MPTLKAFSRWDRLKSREWESHPPQEVYEASLCTLVEFPAIKIGGLLDESPVALGAPARQPSPIAAQPAKLVEDGG